MLGQAFLPGISACSRLSRRPGAAGKRVGGLNSPPRGHSVLTKVVVTIKMESMSEMAPTTARTRRQACPEEATYLELVRTTDALSRRLVQVLKAEDLSATQYNVLRILRGAPEGLTCGEIGNRMITRDPDITRLLDRLERRNLITRSREEKDRRVVLTKITPVGLDALARLDKPVQNAHRAQLGHVGRERLAFLVELLIACRKDE